MRRAVTSISVFFSDEQLEIDTTPTFYISHHVDFLIADDLLLVLNKANFESIVNYKKAHKEDFQRLLNEPEFTSIFADTEALKSFIGDNKLHLRRASAIRQKGHYKNDSFMTNLRAKYAAFQLNIEFDRNGKIVATHATCRDVVRALLDHRLTSGFSGNVYDVPDVTEVNRVRV